MVLKVPDDITLTISAGLDEVPQAIDLFRLLTLEGEAEILDTHKIASQFTHRLCFWVLRTRGDISAFYPAPPHAILVYSGFWLLFWLLF